MLNSIKALKRNVKSTSSMFFKKKIILMMTKKLSTRLIFFVKSKFTA